MHGGRQHYCSTAAQWKNIKQDFSLIWDIFVHFDEWIKHLLYSIVCTELCALEIMYVAICRDFVLPDGGWLGKWTMCNIIQCDLTLCIKHLMRSYGGFIDIIASTLMRKMCRSTPTQWAEWWWQRQQMPACPPAIDRFCIVLNGVCSVPVYILLCQLHHETSRTINAKVHTSGTLFCPAAARFDSTARRWWNGKWCHTLM